MSAHSRDWCSPDAWAGWWRDVALSLVRISKSGLADVCSRRPITAFAVSRLSQHELLRRRSEPIQLIRCLSKQVFSMIAKPLVLLASALLPCAIHTQSLSEKTEVVTLCALRKNPERWDHKLIRVTAYVTHGYEESEIVDPACGDSRDGSEVWMEYGGQIGSGTMYFGSASPRHREKDLVVEAVSLPLLNDAKFKTLDGMLQSMPHSQGVVVVAATVEGGFFSGKAHKQGESQTFGGFGHFGCCSLFVIEKVDSVAERPLDAKEKERFAEAFHLPPPLPPAPSKRR